MRNHLPWFAAAFLLVLVLVAAAAPLLAPLRPGDRDLTALLEPPGRGHPLGTDGEGRDLAAQLVHGARTALVVGISTVLLSLAVGVPLGLLSGWLGGPVDLALMGLTEVFFAFPGILLAMLLIFLAESPSTLHVVAALSATGWAGYARLVRGSVLSERARPYVTAARALGVGPLRLLAVHLLPNVAGPLIVQATFGMAAAILAEASLSFLGLGPQDVPSWGAILDQGAALFVASPHVATAAGLAILGTVLSINVLGDALRDRLDPTSEQGGRNA
ncbi:MAG: ABC transporter permease [Deltaproteobacteria bacterium]|nr:ABC transporter permease [Deltaproteobacteria bacterium]